MLRPGSWPGGSRVWSGPREREEAETMSPVVVWTAPVGGGGATTAVWHFASVAARSGRSVLAVDLSPGMQLSRLFGHGGSPGLGEVLTGRQDLESALAAADCEGCGILPAGALDERILADSAGAGWLAELMRNLASRADLVVADVPACLPRALGDVTRAADWVLVSTPCRTGAVARLGRVLELVAAAGEQGPRVGVVVNMLAVWERSQFETFSAMRRTLPASGLWRTVVPYDEAFEEAARQGRPATTGMADRPGPRAYFDLYAEWMAREMLAADRPERRLDETAGDGR